MCGLESIFPTEFTHRVIRIKIIKQQPIRRYGYLQMGSSLAFSFHKRIHEKNILIMLKHPKKFNYKIFFHIAAIY